jgi:hypothetical protein
MAKRQQVYLVNNHLTHRLSILLMAKHQQVYLVSNHLAKPTNNHHIKPLENKLEGLTILAVVTRTSELSLGIEVCEEDLISIVMRENVLVKSSLRLETSFQMVWGKNFSSIRVNILGERITTDDLTINHDL